MRSIWPAQEYRILIVHSRPCSTSEGIFWGHLQLHVMSTEAHPGLRDTYQASRRTTHALGSH